MKMNKVGSSACGSESQIHEIGSGAKESGLFRCQPGRVVDSHLKDHLAFLLKPMIL